MKKDKSACLLHDYATRSGFIHAPSRAELSHDASHAVEQTLHGILHHQDPISLHVVLGAVTALLVGQIRIPGRSLDPLTQEGTGFGLDGSAVSDAEWGAEGESDGALEGVDAGKATWSTRGCRIPEPKFQCSRQVGVASGIPGAIEDHMNKYEHHGNETDLKAIDSVRDAHVSALNAGDAQAWAAQFTEDGVQMPPNAPVNTGRAMIEAWSHAFLGQFRVQFALAVDEVRVLGEWALERGGYTISLDPVAGGPPLQDIGKYITVYQRERGGAWRMARDIWNSSNPPPRM